MQVYDHISISRLRHPRVGVGRRGEGAAPLVLPSGLLARGLQGDGGRTDGRIVSAVNGERVVSLVLSTRALFLVVIMGVLSVAGLGQRGRHQYQDRTGNARVQHAYDRVRGSITKAYWKRTGSVQRLQR